MTPIFACMLSFSLWFQTGEVIISWNANAESDLAGYKIHWGTESRNYDHTEDLGNRTEFTFTPTNDGIKYYFAVTAYDYTGNESDYSDEVFTPDPIIIPVDTTETDTSTVDPDPDPDPDPTEGEQEELRAYNFPNPFVSDIEATRFRYELAAESPVSISVYNINNELVETLEDEAIKIAGEHTETMWDGRDSRGKLVPQGIYFARIMTSTSLHIVKIAVIRQ